jgi:hypothetical protein
MRTRRAEDQRIPRAFRLRSRGELRRTEPWPLMLEPFRPPSPSETMQQWILICGPGSPCFPVEAPLFALPWQGSQSGEPGPLNATKPRPKPGPEPSQL